MSDLNFTLTQDEANTILAGLSELPAKHSFNVIQKIQQQASIQLNYADAIAEAQNSAPQVLTEG